MINKKTAKYIIDAVNGALIEVAESSPLVDYLDTAPSNMLPTQKEVWALLSDMVDKIEKSIDAITNKPESSKKVK